MKWDKEDRMERRVNFQSNPFTPFWVREDQKCSLRGLFGI